MSRLVEELKVRARLQRNAARHAATAPKLRECLHAAARAVGFQHWEQARRVLGGQAVAGEDVGAFWHAPGCDRLLNLWFASLAQARHALAAAPGQVLLPYRRQFVVAGADYLHELGLDPDDGLWQAAGHDLVRSYGSEAWAALAWQRLQASGARATLR